MTITTLTSREFNQDPGRAKKTLRPAPYSLQLVVGQAHVLLSIEKYQRITRSQTSIVELLEMPGVADIDFTPPRLGDELSLLAVSPLASAPTKCDKNIIIQ